MMSVWNKIWRGIKERGWDKIANWKKHFMGSFFLVLIFYGVPMQRFGWHWNHGMQLFIAATVAWGIGILWEVLGNMSHKDIWVDFAGILTGTLFCLGVWYA